MAPHHRENDRSYVLQPGLDGTYTVFGQVLEGRDLVKQIRRGDVIKQVSILEESEEEESL